LAVGLVPTSGAQASAPAFADGHGVHVVSVQRLSARQYNVAIVPEALGRQVDVRLLLPAEYDSTESRYPSLYLLHGTSGRASDWVRGGDAEATTAGLDLIVVMPDEGFNGNGGGWFTNWVDTKTALGPSQWETYNIDQLIPWIDQNLRTVATRETRGIAGLSQGGFGSTTFPARHPDMFVSAGSFSGAPDIDYNPTVAVGATAVIEATAVGLDGVKPGSMFGDRVTHEANWQGHDPAQLATNLRDVDLWLYTATGAPGPLDPPTPNPAANGIEAATHGSTMSFYERLVSLGMQAHLDDYVFGTHTSAYWARDFRAYIGPLMETFAHPPTRPTEISYMSVEPSWSQWGWSVTLDRQRVQEWSWLDHAGPGGFTLAGTGSAQVVTPPSYAPGSVQVVTMARDVHTHISNVVADASGRLHLTVPLGLVAPRAVMGVPPVPGPGETTTVTIGPAGG
jgi:S-formylglutathione hydrolase FrmB